MRIDDLNNYFKFARKGTGESIVEMQSDTHVEAAVWTLKLHDIATAVGTA